jgi:hypothetical protein
MTHPPLRHCRNVTLVAGDTGQFLVDRKGLRPGHFPCGTGLAVARTAVAQKSAACTRWSASKAQDLRRFMLKIRLVQACVA